MNQPAAIAQNSFRHRIETALAEKDPRVRLDVLAGLARSARGLVETIQLDKALARSAAGEIEGFASVRLAILSSNTIEHLLPGIRIAGLRHRLRFDVFAGAFGQYRQELLDPKSPLFKFRPDLILLSLGARQVVSGVPIDATMDEADEALARAVEELRGLWRHARSVFKASVIQQTYLDVSEPLFGSYDRLVPAAPSRLIARLNDLTAHAAVQEKVMLLDLAQASARDGIDAWFDVGRWLQGKMEIAPQAVSSYGELVARVVMAQRGLSKKCLVLDLDNTLWGGVVGDDGPEGIVLGEGSAAGEAYLALQRYVLQLKGRGIVLAICSKNDAAVAEAAFRDHPEMLLRPEDIAVFIANWEDKASNLRTIAHRLNIGLDSLVFVDDNPAERARVRESLPMIAVPELPDDPAQFVRCLASGGHFESVSFTTEDRTRAQQYAAGNRREALLEASKSVEDFLHDLRMSAVFGPLRPVDLARATQLINKTNQFNPTTRRCSEEELAEVASDLEAIALRFRLLDRFGDNGLVSVLVLRKDRADAGVMEIDTWVMSCRVFGRELEFEAMNIAVEAASRRGIRVFRASYLPTPKNAVIKDLYPTLGFVPSDSKTGIGGATQWQLDLRAYVARRTQIKRAQE
jgi:FkbH-like protein